MTTLAEALAAHTQHLTELYARLDGSPQATVCKKLDELHAALVGTIDEQKRTAEGEVKAVEDECEDLQTQLERIAKVLGKRLAQDPESHSLLTKRKNRKEALEALQAIYRDKKEQHDALITQLQAFIPILGEETIAPICNAEEDLTPPRFTSLREQITACGNEVATRRNLLDSQITELYTLYEELELSPPSNSLQITLPRPSVDPVLSPTQANLTLAASLLSSLEDERVSREAQIQTMFDALWSVWTKLGVEEEYSDEFVEVHAGISNKSLAAYKAELERMEVVKRENMVVFIQREREEVARLRRELFLSDLLEEEDEGECEDADLERVERMRQELEDELSDKKPLLDLVQRYFGLLHEMRELEASANDPSRLLGKGVRGDPGRLLREEKTRKRVAKEKPKLQADLQRKVSDWEEARGTAFMISGSRFLEDLAERMELDSASSKRIPARSKTPLPLTAQNTGMSNSNGPLKRQQTGQSTTSSTSQPSKRIRTGLATPSTSRLPQTSTINRNQLPSNWGLQSAKPPSQLSVMQEANSRRKSFRPRPSSTAFSVAPSSLFSGRTASSASSVFSK